MDTKFKLEWIKRLRSGKHEQGKHELRRGDAFCCLGVLRDVIRPGTKVKSVILTDRDLKATELELDVAQELAEMNDFGNQSFAEIADYIEANL